MLKRLPDFLPMESLRILFLSNFFPPVRLDGYSQWCHEVALELQARGHAIEVLTSQYDKEKVARDELKVHRLLHLNAAPDYYEPLEFFTSWKRQRTENAMFLEEVVASFAPDLIFVWGMWDMSLRLPAHAERVLPGRVVYYLSDYWPTNTDLNRDYWISPANHRSSEALKSVLRRAAFRILGEDVRLTLAPERTICVSAAVRDILVERGLDLKRAYVIHGGTDVNRFSMVRKRDFQRKPLRLLYAGQLVWHKGVHTAVEAMGKVAHEYGVDEACLNIVGSGHPDYEHFLAGLVAEKGLTALVHLQGPISRDRMPEILDDADILIFPSIYEEPFARTVQEAMLAGLAVVGSTTGGTKEILEDGENGLTFAAEDSDGLARQIIRLLEDRELCRRFADAGRQTVLEKYTLDKMVDGIESLLETISADAVAHPAAG